MSLQLHRPATALTLVSAAICLFILHPTQAAALTPPQIVQRCQRAYSALRSYQGNTTVTTLGNDGKRTYHTSAHILFARPNKIRAAGADMMGGQFAYVSNGAATYQNIGGHWSRSQNAEMAIAGATGIGQNAATTVPALLLHTRWGAPFSRALKFAPTVGREAIGGTPCYRVTATSPMGTETFWIDSRTFLMKRFVNTFSGGNFHLHQDERFSGERLNAPIPSSSFALPPGH